MSESKEQEEIELELHELIISLGMYLLEEESAHIDDIDLPYIVALRDALDVEIKGRMGVIH